jgi:hypothetical protein
MEEVGIFMDFCSILRPFDIFYGHLVYVLCGNLVYLFSLFLVGIL